MRRSIRYEAPILVLPGDQVDVALTVGGEPVWSTVEMVARCVAPDHPAMCTVLVVNTCLVEHAHHALCYGRHYGPYSFVWLRQAPR